MIVLNSRIPVVDIDRQISQTRSLLVKMQKALNTCSLHEIALQLPRDWSSILQYHTSGLCGYAKAFAGKDAGNNLAGLLENICLEIQIQYCLGCAETEDNKEDGNDCLFESIYIRDELLSQVTEAIGFLSAMQTQRRDRSTLDQKLSTENVDSELPPGMDFARAVYQETRRYLNSLPVGQITDKKLLRAISSDKCHEVVIKELIARQREIREFAPHLDWEEIKSWKQIKRAYHRAHARLNHPKVELHDE